VHLVDFTIEIYHDARSHELQICNIAVNNAVEYLGELIVTFWQ